MEMVLKRQQALRKQGKKGFTLVELIVVIVILGILAAIAVPALVGYIDKARTDGAITEAATARTALQTIVSDAYGHETNTKGVYSFTYSEGSNSKTIYLRATTTAGVTTIESGTFTNNVFAVDSVANSSLIGAINTLTSAKYGSTPIVATDLTVVTAKNWQVDTFKIKVPSGSLVELKTTGEYEVTAPTTP